MCQISIPILDSLEFGLAEQRFLTIDDLSNMKPPAWAVEGMFEINSLVMVAGPPASLKSFLAIDWMMCIVTGRKWNGRRVANLKCLYVLGEGKANLLKRLQVWIYHNKPNAEEIERLRKFFRVSFEVPQMALKSSVDNMLAGLEKEDFQPDVIVIDTFARSFVGLDENSQKDTGMWVESADRLRQLGYTVIFLHHTKRNTEFGVQYRGSSAIMGAMDTAITFVRDDQGSSNLTLTITKQKDHDEGQPMHFQKVIIKPDGNADEGSCILAPIVKVDQRFDDEYQRQENVIKEIIGKNPHGNQSDLAREVANTLLISEQAARSRVRYRLAKMAGGKSGG